MTAGGDDTDVFCRGMSGPGPLLFTARLRFTLRIIQGRGVETKKQRIPRPQRRGTNGASVAGYSR